jgi:hypothetical protein
LNENSPNIVGIHLALADTLQSINIGGTKIVDRVAIRSGADGDALDALMSRLIVTS